MTDGDDTAAAVCPWCSAALPDPDVELCPSCNAALNSGTEQSVPGLTALDAEAIIRAKQPTRQRSRLLSWFGGDIPDDAISPADAGAVALPDAAVKVEMLRLQIASDIANLQAEAVAIQTDAALEGRVVEIPDAAELAGIGAAPDETANAVADAATEPTDASDVAAADAAPDEPEADKPA
jgi:hypothetical protein